MCGGEEDQERHGMGREKPNYVTNVVLQAPTTENDDRVPVSARRGYLILPRAPLPPR